MKGLPGAGRLAIAVLIVLSGCAGPVHPDCQGGASCQPSPSDKANPAEDLVELLACNGVFGIIPVPASTAAKYVPTAFRPVGGAAAAPGTAEASLFAVRCDHVVINNASSPAAALLQLHIRVVPSNQTWATARTGFYWLAIETDNAELAAVLARHETPAEIARFTPGPQVAPTDAKHWSFAGANGTFELDFQPSSAQHVGEQPAKHNYWSGPGPFHRTDWQQEYEYDGAPNPGAVRSSGTGPGPGLLGPQQPFTSQTQYVRNATMRFVPDLFS